MIVTAYKQTDGIFIPFEFLKNIINQEFTQLIVDINIIEYKNEIVRKTSGILKNYNIDGVKYQNKIRNEWK